YWPSSSRNSSGNRCARGSTDAKPHRPHTHPAPHPTGFAPQAEEQTVGGCCCHWGCLAEPRRAASAHRHQAPANQPARHLVVADSWCLWCLVVSAVDQQLLQLSALAGQWLTAADPLTCRGVATARDTRHQLHLLEA